MIMRIIQLLKEDTTYPKRTKQGKNKRRWGRHRGGSQQAADQQAGPEARGGKASQGHKNRSRPQNRPKARRKGVDRVRGTFKKDREDCSCSSQLGLGSFYANMPADGRPTRLVSGASAVQATSLKSFRL